LTPSQPDAAAPGDSGQPPQRAGGLGPLVRQLNLGTAFTLTALAALLHLVLLFQAGGLWRDEVNSVRFARMPSLATVFSSLRYDSYPVGSTLFFRLWALVAGTDQGFRVAGLLVGLAILAALWWNARILKPGIPLLSLILLAVNPVLLRYGDSVRPYGLGILFTVLAFGFFARLTAHPSARNFCWACLSAILSVQCLFQNALLVAVFCLAGVLVSLGRRRYFATLRLAGAGAIAALSLLPYLGPIRAAGEWAALTQTSAAHAVMWKILSDALSAQADFMLPLWCGLCVLGLLAAVIFARPASAAPADGKDVLVFSAIALAAAVPVFLAFIRAMNLPTQVWYFLPLMAPCAACLDALFAPLLRTRIGRLAAPVAAIAVVILLTPRTWASLQLRATNVDLVASAITDQASPHDLIVVSPWYMGVSFARHYSAAARWTTLPPLEDHSIHRYDLLKLSMQLEDPIAPVLQAARDTLAAGNRLWYVGVLVAPPAGSAPPVLPPAPHGPQGWFSPPYNDAWMLRFGAFLAAHAGSVSAVPVEAPNPVSPLENVPLVVFSGWRP